MKEIKGDLLELADNGLFDVIGHGCNCFSTMGAGIAKQIKAKYPLAFYADKKSKMKPEEKLGKILYIQHSVPSYVVNMYTQFDFKGKHNADYAAIRSCMKELKLNFKGLRIGLPQIGAGLAGGDWNIISKIIEDELKGEDVTIVIYEPKDIIKIQTFVSPGVPLFDSIDPIPKQNKVSQSEKIITTNLSIDDLI